MEPTKRLRFTLLVGALLAVSCIAGAQPKPLQLNELVVAGGLMAGGEPDPSGAFGFTYSRFLNATQSIDVSIIRQPTTMTTEEGSEVSEIDLDIDYYHIGGRYTAIRYNSKLRPYVSMSLGMSRFAASPGETETGFSVGFGGGTDIMLSPSVALRFDARLYTTIALTSGAIYCENQTCTAFASGGSFGQFAGTGGLVFKF